MREPDISGIGQAWRVTARAARDQDATVSAYIVNGPWHPAWSYWMVAAVHLRDMEGQSKPAHKQFPEATHEFLIVSLESAPGSPQVKPDPDDPQTLRHLTPPDVITQFTGTDEEAEQLVELSVEAIVKHGQSPDSDYRRWWVAAVPNTLEHIRTGGHH